LREQGYSVWFDESLPAHRAYSEVIAEKLDSAAAVLVLWSEDAVRSQWVRSEANRARETGRLVQAGLDAAQLPMPFDQVQCADLSKWRGRNSHAGWRQVSGSIEALVGTPANERSTHSPNSPIGRRGLLAGGAAVAVAGAATLFWRVSSKEEQLSPQAKLLMQKGFDALQDNDVLDPAGPGSTMQAIALLTEATKAAPNSSVVWGGLALAYAVRKRTVPLADRPGLDMRSRAAAKRSLELDPREGRAIGALLLLDPVYRHWLARERADRAAVGKNSSIPLLFSITSDMLGNVGRWKDALSFSSHIDREHFLIAGAERKFIVDLWGAGDLQEADNALQSAVEHWPQNAEIWRTRIPYLMYSGRAAEALDLLREDAERPTEIHEDFVRAMRSAAQALAGARPAQSATDDVLNFLRANPLEALRAANACCALGALDDSFEILEGYYFNAGKWAYVAPAAGDADRITQPLFVPAMKNAWGDPRFDSLLQRIGLNEYWRRSGTVPDFRRA
jgi:hypothetical protein